MKDEIKLPGNIIDGLKSVNIIIDHLEQSHVPFDIQSAKRIFKDGFHNFIGLSIKIRIEAFNALEWIFDNPENGLRALESIRFRCDEIYFKKMQMLHESMKEYRLYENLDRSEIVNDFPYLRDFASVQNVPIDIKMNFFLVTNLIYEIEMRNLKFDQTEVDNFLSRAWYALDKQRVVTDLREVLNWVVQHPDENYIAIAPWYILENKEYFDRMVILKIGIDRLMDGLTHSS